MNFHQLKYIIAVDKYRNFARAAEDCEIAQSTLSKEIQRLEKEFDIMIFDRSRHPVVPTMKGQDLIQQAKIILEHQNKFINIAKQKKNAPVGNFKLGILPTLAPYLLPLFAQQITEKYPELNLKISETGPSEMIEALENGDLDAAISLSPFEKEGFYETILFDEEFVLYVGKNHPLSALETVKWENIPLEELILQEDIKSHFLENQKNLLPPIVQKRNFKNVSFQNGSLETIRKIIDRNGGLTLIPQLACLYMGERRLEMVRHIEEPKLSRKIIFVEPRGFEKNRISKVILKEIVKAIPAESLTRAKRSR
ncbi:MAG TPA: LysR substrate-binding domain-containing protein [Salinimicrobium sp.]|nr:LysR substrate-binding domain-containing protein [Salinimicrobium sp.]